MVNFENIEQSSRTHSYSLDLVLAVLTANCQDGFASYRTTIELALPGSNLYPMDL